jgi:hypothetical protein
MTLSRQVVNLIWLDFQNNVLQTIRTGKIAIVQPHFGFIAIMGITINVIYPVGVESAGSTDDAMNFVPFAEEQLS